MSPEFDPSKCDLDQLLALQQEIQRYAPDNQEYQSRAERIITAYQQLPMSGIYTPKKLEPTDLQMHAVLEMRRTLALSMMSLLAAAEWKHSVTKPAAAEREEIVRRNFDEKREPVFLRE